MKSAFVTASGAAQILGVSTRTVHRARQTQGHILGVPFVQINRRWVISGVALEAQAR